MIARFQMPRSRSNTEPIVVSPRSSLLASSMAWLPLAALMALFAVSIVTGRAPIGSASAASVVPVTGSVAADVSIDTAACLPGAVAIGEILPGSDPWKTAQDTGGGTCEIAFGTTNATAGVSLDVLEDPAAPATPTDAMKCIGPGCGGASLTDYSGGAEPAAGTSAFGAQLLSSSAGATQVWSAEPAVNAIPDAGETTCQSSGVGMESCSFTFGATAAVTDVPSAYQAQVRYVALAR